MEDDYVKWCIKSCREEYWSGISEQFNEQYGIICTYLSQPGTYQELWQLYWCDSNYCGVSIDQNAGKGQDR